MANTVDASMRKSTPGGAPRLAQTSPITTLASATAAVRAGTLAALIPGLVAANASPGTWLILALHILGALATLSAILMQSRAGLLLAVLFTGYSTVVMALEAPNNVLGLVTWIIGGATLLMTLICAARARRKQNLRGPLVAALVGAIVGFLVLSILR